MICPNCNSNIQNRRICYKCGVDSFLFRKTNKASDALYNQALAQVKINDLTGAIETLEKSILFNKGNITARNLLGLVHYEVGHLGDALKHWVISTSYVKEKNVALEYLNIVQNSGRALEKYNDSIKMYNQALEYMQQKSDDMALIQLKKAIEINPKFINALNLLAFCYLLQKERDKALVMVDKVLSLDTNNQVALRYYQEIQGRARPDPQPIPRAKKSAGSSKDGGHAYAHLTPKSKKSFGGTFHLAEILSFCIGALIAVAIMYILVMPGMIDVRDREISSLEARLITTEERYLEARREDDDAKQELEQELTLLREQNHRLEMEWIQQYKIQRLTSAQSLFATGDLEGAVNLLYETDFSELSAEYVGAANELREELYPRAARMFYERGVGFYNAQNLTSARADFLRSQQFDDQDTHTENVLFHLGSIAEQQQNTTLARQYYEQLLVDFPASGRVNNIRWRLNNLNQ